MKLKNILSIALLAGGLFSCSSEAATEEVVATEEVATEEVVAEATEETEEEKKA